MMLAGQGLAAAIKHAGKQAIKQEMKLQRRDPMMSKALYTGAGVVTGSAIVKQALDITDPSQDHIHKRKDKTNQIALEKFREGLKRARLQEIYERQTSFVNPRNYIHMRKTEAYYKGRQAERDAVKAVDAAVLEEKRAESAKILEARRQREEQEWTEYIWKGKKSAPKAKSLLDILSRPSIR